VIAADPNLKATYPDVALFFILARPLPASFKPFTRAFIEQPTLSIEEKINILVEHEMDLNNEEIKTEKVHITKASSQAPKHHHRRSKSDSDKRTLIK
jgi:hypothetical protein